MLNLLTEAEKPQAAEEADEEAEDCEEENWSDSIVLS